MSKPASRALAGVAALAEERWFLRIDGHNYGPVPRAELENFLRPPRLCSVMEVKCGDGVWFTIARHETIDKVLEKVGIDVEPMPEPVRQPVGPSRVSSLLASLGEFCEGLFAWLLYHWIATTVVVLYLAVNAIFLFALRDPHDREREVLSRYEAWWNEAQALGASESAEKTWHTFAEPARAELASIVRELERSASVEQPIRQNLLFAGREHLLKILKDDHPPKLDANDARLFTRRLDLARQQLPKDEGAKSASPPGTKTGGRP